MMKSSRAVLVTLGILVIYGLGAYVPTLWLNAEPGVLPRGFSFFSLGLAPFMGAFFWVEVFSFLLPAGRALRGQGFAGRKILNRWAWGLSSVFAFLMVAGFLVSLRGMDLSLWHFLAYGIFLLLGFAILVVLAKITDRFGLGNGFALLLLADLGGRTLSSAWRDWHWLPPSQDPAQRFGPLLLSALLMAVVFVFFLRKKTVDGTVEGQSLRFELSPVPQGIYSVPLAFSAYLFFSLGLNTAFGIDLNLLPGSVSFFGEAGFLLLTSAFTYLTAYSPSHIFRNTFGRLALGEGEIRRVRNWAMAGTILFVVWKLLPLIPHPFLTGQGIVEEFVPLVSVIFLFFLLRDLWGHACFLRLVPEPVNLGEFDNIHFLALAKGLAESKGIRVYLPGFEYRRLMAYFAPLIKMRLLVEPAREQELRTLLKLESLPTV